MTYILLDLLIYIFILTSCSSSQESLEIELLNDSVSITTGDSEVALTLACRNGGTENLLLYGIMSNLRTNADIERLCNINRVGGGVGLMLLNQSMSPVHVIESIPDSIDYKQYDNKHFSQEMEKGKARFLAGTRILKASEVLNLEMIVNIRQFNLKPGRYYIQMVYYAGKGLKDNFVVGEEQIEKDMKLFDAVLYQGCAVSNKISITVN
ncbi:hypothetical protein KK083_19095 [Fulvivirgaceae bacterium PWU4]|uniref:Uncharacterized protein n=1 Tax=Chryseosolibacter histidini TaxID=2782349 RepID=A0AAP2GKG4_9BACT|nr:hypothetical protein [Chryseosolibacter histidini]MBT1699009.1 hypothetical protein [Chryseosolibacter histidini]